MKSILTSLFSLVLCATLHAQIPSYVPADGLVGWWPFNGNANDESGNGNHGVVNGATLAEDRFGNAGSVFSFDGSPDRVEIGNSLNPSTSIGTPNSSWSASAWINRNNYTGVLAFSDYNSIAGNTNPGENDITLAIHLQAWEDKAYITMRSNAAEFGTQGGFITADQWHHIAFTAANGLLSLFVDGVEASSVSYNSNLNFLESPIYRMGSSMWNGNYGPSNGLVDDIAIYNRALTPAEITQLYTAAEEPVATCAPLAPNLQNGLVGYWPFCGNANDESGNGNNGVVNGATLAEDRFGNANAAYSFDGVDDDIDIVSLTNANLSSNSSFTISLWFNSNGNNYGRILSYSTDVAGDMSYRLQVVHESSGLVTFNGALSTGQANPPYVQTSTTPVSLNTWHHILINYEAHFVTIFLNGIAISTAEYTGPDALDMQNSNVHIGYITNEPTERFSGSIDDIAIYNRALTPAEITQLYAAAEEPVATCTPLAPNLQNGLVGYWPFCGNANDESGNGNNGVVNGATLAEDRFGNANAAYSFDGELDFIASNTITSNSDISISIWANLYTLSGYPDDQTLFLRNYHPFYDIGYDQPSQRAFFGINNGSWTKVYSPVLNNINWFHITAVFSPGNYVKIYFNGVLSDSINTSISALTNLGSSLFFGGEIDGPFKSINGSIDDIAIYNRALTPEEIAQLYTGAAAPCNLIASETQDTPVEVGGSAQMYVTLNANDYSMQWQTNAAGLGWMDVQDNNTYTGSQTQNLLISNAALANHEQPFRIIVTDGICNDTSDVALLLVNNTCTAFDTITTTVEVFDTLTIENVVEVYDTLTIYNTIDVFDTTNVTVEVFDTITNVIDVFDTTTVYLQVDIYDTLFIDVYDTTYIQQTIDVYDTTYVTLTDTTYIQVIDTAYVTVTDTLLIDITFVGFEGQPSWLNTVLVYPNPASDHITIDYGNFALMAGYNTVITDAAGATVYSSAVNTQQATIDINAWGAAGVYYLSVFDVNGAVVAVRQIVLE